LLKALRAIWTSHLAGVGRSGSIRCQSINQSAISAGPGRACIEFGPASTTEITKQGYRV